MENEEKNSCKSPVRKIELFYTKFPGEIFHCGLNTYRNL